MEGQAVRLKPPSETGTWTLQDNRDNRLVPTSQCANAPNALKICCLRPQRLLRIPPVTELVPLSSSRYAASPLPRNRSVPSGLKDPDVFTNSLSKTLEAHRSSNRASLIRKVYSRDPSPGLFRPCIPPENRAGYQPPAPPPPPPPLAPAPAPAPTIISNDGVKGISEKLQSKADQLSGICRADSSVYDSFGQQPWLKYMQPFEATGDAYAYLDAEIRALNSYLSSSSEEQKQTERLYEELDSLLLAICSSPPKRIGLRSIGLAPAHSAIQLMLPFRDTQRSPDQIRKPSASRPQIRRAHMGLLGIVKSALMNSSAFENVTLIKYGPCLEARHKSTGLKVRITCGEQSPAIFEYLQDYLNEYPALPPLFRASQALIEACCTPFNHMHIDSNALVLLLVAFLKMNHGRFTGPRTLGHQWMAFLKLYGSGVDLSSVGVALDPPSFFGNGVLSANDHADAELAYLRGQRSLMRAKLTAKAQGNLQLGQSLCIQDPTHFMQDLGRSSTRIKEVQSELKAAHERISKVCEQWEGPSDDASILAAALRASFEGFEKRRRQTTHGPWADAEAADQ